MMDYYDLFPEFSIEEINLRRKVMPISRATLLTTRNLVTLIDAEAGGAELVRAGLRADLTERKRQLRDALLEAGIATVAADCISRVSRDRFVRSDLRHIAYLNVSIPARNGSWLSVPGLLGPMIEWLSEIRPGRIVEFGSGSGYQLAVMSEFFADVPVVGYEIDTEMCAFSERACLRAGYRATIVNRRFQDFDDFKTSDSYLFTFTPLTEDFGNFLSSVKLGSRVLYPRILSSEEFEHLDPIRRNKYSSYKEYVDRPMTVSLSSVQLYDSGYLQKQDVLTRVKFVRDRVHYGNRHDGDLIVSDSLQRIISLL